MGDGEEYEEDDTLGYEDAEYGHVDQTANERAPEVTPDEQDGEDEAADGAGLVDGAGYERIHAEVEYGQEDGREYGHLYELDGACALVAPHGFETLGGDEVGQKDGIDDELYGAEFEGKGRDVVEP